MGNALSTPPAPQVLIDFDDPASASQQTTPHPNALRSVDSFIGPVATPITWAHDGHSVFVTGAWDNWVVRTPLSHNGPLDPFFVVLSLPPGVYQYKYIVDGNWM
eukprot:IDg18832t1